MPPHFTVPRVIVLQLKAGSITKEELFLKLSSLQVNAELDELRRLNDLSACKQPLTSVQKSKKPAADASPQPTSPSAPR